MIKPDMLAFNKYLQECNEKRQDAFEIKRKSIEEHLSSNTVVYFIKFNEEMKQ